MLEILHQAVMQAFSDTFGAEITRDTHPIKTGFVSKIHIIKDGNRLPVFFIIKEPFLKELANILLFEENPDQETLRDLSCELANIVVGSAKVIAGKQNLSIDISTPEFHSETGYDEPLHETLNYQFADSKCTLFIGNING